MTDIQTNDATEFDHHTRVESTLRAMHDIQMASEGIEFASQVRGILEIGIRQLGLPVGLVSRLDGDRISLPYVVGGVMPFLKARLSERATHSAAKVFRDGAAW